MSSPPERHVPTPADPLPDTPPKPASGIDGPAALAIALALTLWASAFVGIRAGLTAYGPGHLALFRFLIASACMAVYAVATRMPPPRARDLPAILLHGALGFTGYHLFLNYGEVTVSAASACFIINFIPVFSALLSALILGERIRRRMWGGMVVSMFGIGLIAMAEGEALRLEAGAFLVLAAALCESLFFVLQKKNLSRYDPVAYTAYTMWAGTLLMLVYAPGLTDAVLEAPAHATWAVVYLGVFPAAVAYAAWTFALARTAVARIAFTQYAMPVITIMIGLVWLGEIPPTLSLFGGFLALGGVALVSLPSLAGLRVRERLVEIGRTRRRSR